MAMEDIEDRTEHYVVRYGRAGYLGRFAGPVGVFGRAARVVVRSTIGVQLGQVLSAVTSPSLPLSGSIVRPATPQDELLDARLAQHRPTALEACRRRLREAHIEATLIDAEFTLDATTLCFYFLEDPPPAATDDLLPELGTVYRAAAGIESFAELLETGCGPGCGTDEATGCGSGACAVCVVARACPSNSPSH